MSNIVVDIQQASGDSSCLPTRAQWLSWVSAAVADRFDRVELTIRLVDEPEMVDLNQRYRHKQGVTNILAFPCELPAGVELAVPFLGDLVICVPCVLNEARAQHKTIEAHFAHLVVHGCLHLLGFDHETLSDAQVMEAHEIRLLSTLGITNPYIGADQSE